MYFLSFNLKEELPLLLQNVYEVKQSFKKRHYNVRLDQTEWSRNIMPDDVIRPFENWTKKCQVFVFWWLLYGEIWILDKLFKWSKVEWKSNGLLFQWGS